MDIKEKKIVNKILLDVIKRNVKFVDKNGGIFSCSKTLVDGIFELHYCNNKICNDEFYLYNDIINSISESKLDVNSCEIGVFEGFSGTVTIDKENSLYHVSTETTATYFINCGDEEIINENFRKTKSDFVYSYFNDNLGLVDLDQRVNENYKFLVKSEKN